MVRFIRLAVMCAYGTLTLVACLRHATAENYAKMLATYRGHTSSKVIQYWGPPDKVFKMKDGTEAYTYYRYVGTSGTSSRAPRGSVEHSSTADYCKTTFFIGKDDRVKGDHFQGNMCIRRPTREEEKAAREK